MHSVALEVKRYILKNELILPHSTVICGFSGGADSMCMLEILHELSKELDFRTVAVHLNHGLRKADADNDELVCKSFCEARKIEFFSKKVDIKKLAEEQGRGQEETGRNERYAFFNQVAEKYTNALVATAHTKNDLAETVLHRVIRGSSVKGLSGIRPKRDNIIRPVLCLTRDQVEAFCEDKNLEFVTDKTNFETVYTRNKIRLEIIPRLKNVNSAVIDALSVLAENSAADSDFIEKIADESYRQFAIEADNGICVSVSDILKSDKAIRRRIILKMAEKYGISLEYRHIEAIEEMCINGETGKACDIPGGCAIISYGKLKIFLKSGVNTESFYIKAGSGETVKAGRYEINVKILENDTDAEIVIRARKNGDRIVCNGMTKKLKKVFIDLKIPKFERETIPVVEINGEIFCVGDFLKSDYLKKAKDKIKVSLKKTGIN